MVTSIGGTNLAHTLPVGTGKHKTETAVAVPAATTQALEGGTATVPSAQARATARVGGELDAQFDASRLQGAQDETPVDTAGTNGAATAESAAAEASGTNAAPAGAGGARMSGSASSSDSASTDYIAEADTNNDRKVSEQERVAYAKKQASEAQQSREQEVRQAYLPQETAGAQLDISA